jgi:outer membrane protein assembly factor BamB
MPAESIGQGAGASRGIRWWPAVAICLLALAALIKVLAGDGEDQQSRQLGLLAIVVVALHLLFLWLILFSRLSGRLRLRIFLGGLAAVALFFALFRIEGVTGNLMPIATFRFGGGQGLEAFSRLGRAEVATTRDDFPQFLGPRRNGMLEGLRLDPDWQARPPRQLWRRPVGEGWSGFAVVGKVALTQEQRAGHEVVAAYHLETGEPIWSHAAEDAYTSPIGGNGPRATPTVDGGHVFTLSATGLLRALDLATGQLLWQRQAREENGGRQPEWGYAGSPLLVGDLVVVSVGGEGKLLAAYRRQDGEPAWTGGGDRSGFASPMLAKLAGREMIVAFNHASISGHDPADGKTLWTTPWSERQANVAQPVPLGGDLLLVSSGYGVGSAVYRIEPKTGGEGYQAVEQWATTRMKAKFTNLVVHEGDVYGLDDGVLACLDPATGERRWKAGRYGHGQVLLVSDLLLVQTEEGELVLVDPDPKELKELHRVRVLEGKSWNSPTLAGKYLLVRNGAEAAAYELALL